jgi:hypothetical protein
LDRINVHAVACLAGAGLFSKISGAVTALLKRIAIDDNTEEQKMLPLLAAGTVELFGGCARVPALAAAVLQAVRSVEGLEGVTDHRSLNGAESVARGAALYGISVLGQGPWAVAVDHTDHTDHTTSALPAAAAAAADEAPPIGAGAQPQYPLGAEAVEALVHAEAELARSDREVERALEGSSRLETLVYRLRDLGSCVPIYPNHDISYGPWLAL